MACKTIYISLLNKNQSFQQFYNIDFLNKYKINKFVAHRAGEENCISTRKSIYPRKKIYREEEI